MPRAINWPVGPLLRKKGSRHEAEIPFLTTMVPKGGLDRLSLGLLAIGLGGGARG